jgi:hypothetical protein
VTNSALIGTAVWGFLVGFAGWPSVFRLVEPISDWLFPLRSRTSAAQSVARLLVMLLLIAAGLMATALGPMLVMVAAPSTDASPQGWRSLFGASFVASLVGTMTNGAIGRRGRES